MSEHRVIEGDKDITEEWNIACLSGVTLTHACESLDLPHSGSKRALASRLVAAGLTCSEVEARFGWRARRCRTGEPR